MEQVQGRAVLLLLYCCFTYACFTAALLLLYCRFTHWRACCCLVFVCSHPNMYVSSYYDICPLTTIYVSSCYYSYVSSCCCYVCPHTTIYVSSYYYSYVSSCYCYVCPRTTIYVSSYYYSYVSSCCSYVCPRTTIYVSSYYYVCVLVLL